jgi:hypothetical protein
MTRVPMMALPPLAIMGAGAIAAPLGQRVIRHPPVTADGGAGISFDEAKDTIAASDRERLPYLQSFCGFADEFSTRYAAVINTDVLPPAQVGAMILAVAGPSPPLVWRGSAPHGRLNPASRPLLPGGLQTGSAIPPRPPEPRPSRRMHR